jgi:hypothetical protein
MDGEQSEGVECPICETNQLYKSYIMLLKNNSITSVQ